MFKINVFQVLFVILFSWDGYGQNTPVIDSLLKALENLPEDSTQVKVLNKLCGEYTVINPDKAMEYGKRGLDLANRLDYQRGIVVSLNEIGIVYDYKGEYEKSLDFQLRALEKQEELGFRKEMASSLYNVAGIYFLLGKIEDAIDYNQQSLVISREMDDKYGVAMSLIIMGILYGEKGDLGQSLSNFRESLKICKDNGYENGVALNLGNIGYVYNERGKTKEALNYFQQALDMYLEGEDKQAIASGMNNVGSVYLKIGQFQKAQEYFQNSLAIVRQLGMKQDIKNAYQNIASAYSEQGDFKKAYEYHKLYSLVKDSLLNDNSSLQITEMQTKYESEKKERENELLQNKTEVQELQLSRRNYLIYGLIGVAAFLLVIGLLIINQNKLRAKQKAVELEQNAMKLEQQLLRSQMNPHFIFNSLNAIQSFLYDHDPEEAGNYLSKFAMLVRLILENSRREFIPLDKEIKFLEHYLALQRLRFEKEFDFIIDVSSDIDTKATAIPPMLAQPFIENALEHGLQHSETKGLIQVKFGLNENELIFSIEDNGIGRTASAKLGSTNNGKHESLATKITEERLLILKKRHDQNISMSITDLENSDNGVKGTKVSFHIPFRFIEFDK